MASQCAEASKPKPVGVHLFYILIDYQLTQFLNAGL